MSAASSVGVWGIALTGGLLADRFGFRKVMSFCTVLTGCVLVLVLWADSLFHFMLVMLIAGAARGAVFPGSTKAVVEWFPPRERATAMGFKQLGMPIAGVAAAALLPALGLALGWRSGMAAPGLLILATGVVVALAYVDAPASATAKSARVDVRQAVGGLARNRMLLTLCILGFCFLLVQLALVSYLALYFKDVVLVSAIPDEGARIVAAGGYLAVCHLGGAVARVFWGYVSDRLLGGLRVPVLLVIGTLSALSMFLLASLGDGRPLWLVAMVCFACGTTALGWNGVHGALITDIAGRKYAATGIGLSMTATDIATIASPPLFGLVVDLTTSYQSAWLLYGCFAAAGALVAIVLRGQEIRRRAALPSRG